MNGRKIIAPLWLILFVLTNTTCDNPLKEDNSPIITQYQPQQLQLSKSINDTISFSLTATDEDGDAVNYKFLKDGDEVISTITKHIQITYILR